MEVTGLYRNGENNNLKIDLNVIRLLNGVPRPQRVKCVKLEDNDRPPHLGEEYHGHLSVRQAETLLSVDGHYLVRQGKTAQTYTLSLRANGAPHHYHLHYDGRYFLKPDKKFARLEMLVGEGLFVAYLNLHGPSLDDPTVSTDIVPSAEKIISSNTALKSHHFKLNYWPHRCAWCGELAIQPYKCQDCGCEVHQKCVERITAECSPPVKLNRVFGVDLEHFSSRRPFIVDVCIDEIEKRGLDAEGLYRVSGFSDEIETLKFVFERDGEKTDVSRSAYDSIHVITGVLKRWLILLPQPLIPQLLQPVLRKALMRDRSSSRIAVKEALKLLSPVQWDTLSRLMEHLQRVVATPENRMTPLSLAVVFGPTLMLSDSWSRLDDNINVVQFLIQEFKYIF